MMTFFDYPIIDMHTHLRNNIPYHTGIAKESGIDVVVYMANTDPPLDNIDAIINSLNEERFCKAFPVSAITKNLEGRELVDVDEIKSYVVGFSDDGKYLEDLGLLKEILQKGVLVMAHCSPSYELGIENPQLETRFIERYLNTLKDVGGRLHIQHVSQKDSVYLIREAKKDIAFTCETCPHYFTYTRDGVETMVNPPLGTYEDMMAVREGLADGTIDVTASDYAPFPRKTGIACFYSFLPLLYGLVLHGVLSEEQLKDKLFANPMDILNLKESDIK